MRITASRLLVVTALAASAVVVSSAASAVKPSDANPPADVAAYWTPERVASAQPRDLVIDQRGLGYLKRSDGSLTPYGHTVRARLEQVSAGTPVARAKPGSSSDSTPPKIVLLQPTSDLTQGGTVSFSATITDDSGIKSVSLVVGPDGGLTQTFSIGELSTDTYGTELTGFSNGPWTYEFIAKDNAGRGGNTATSGGTFMVDTTSGGGSGGGGGGGGGGVVTNSEWVAGGYIQKAAGRILFEMPQVRGKRITGWVAYVCSGTAVQNTNTDASVILTAAHCVYDDVAKMFAQNVYFIPDQAGTTGAGTDWNCGNDPSGCYLPSHGVVDENWTTRTFPANVEWDYAYYVVPNMGAHSGPGDALLEAEVTGLPIGFGTATVPDVTDALGYSYSKDPNFMYCAEPMQVETPNVNWWLPSCGLSGGSSGGPWVQPMDETTGSGPIISVNSWGYTNQPGMAGPVLDGSAECVFAQANNADAVPVNRGVIVSGCTNSYPTP